MTRFLCECPRCKTRMPFVEENALVKKIDEYLMPCPACTKIFKVFIGNLIVTTE
jgi:transposase-like protein